MIQLSDEKHDVRNGHQEQSNVMAALFGPILNGWHATRHYRCVRNGCRANGTNENVAAELITKPMARV